MFSIKRPSPLGLAPVWLLASACAVDGASNATSATQASSLEWKDNGTQLTASLEAVEGGCDGASFVMLTKGQITSTASASFVELIALVDGTEASSVIVVEPGQFKRSGKNKVAEFESAVELIPGAHTAQLCLAQRGAQGRSEKMACADAFDYRVDCAVETPEEPSVPEPSELDDAPPEITASRSPAPNADGWNKESVLVSFTCQDDREVSFCSPPTVIDQEGAGQAVTGRALDASGKEANVLVSDINIDKTEPTVAASRDRAPNEHGWYKDDVTVSFVCEDDLSGVKQCAEALLVSEEGAALSAPGFGIDLADNLGTLIETGIAIDRTSPSVEILGARTYLVDEMVDVSCAISDELSGVAEQSCAAASGDAYRFALGDHAAQASATDRAGNASSAEASFRIEVTAASLCNLLERFVEKSGVAHALCVKLEGAERDLERGNLNAASGKLGAYQNQLAAQNGKAVPEDKFEILRDLGEALGQ